MGTHPTILENEDLILTKRTRVGDQRSQIGTFMGAGLLCTPFMKAGTYIPYLMSVDGQGFFWGPICVFWVQDVSGLGGRVGVKWGK